MRASSTITIMTRYFSAADKGGNHRSIDEAKRGRARAVESRATSAYLLNYSDPNAAWMRLACIVRNL
jgi:hypothetical protein